METEKLSFSTKELEEIHKLLKQNNALLYKIIKHNQLIAETTIETIWHYSYYFLWPESEKLKKKRKKLEDFYKEIMEQK